MRSRVLWAAIVGLAWIATPAAAQDDVTGNLRFSKIYSYGGGVRPHHGFGLDARYSIFPTRTAFHVGVFAQSTYELDAGDVWRFAGGATIGFAAMQLEVGVAYRTASQLEVGTMGLQIGQSILLGPFAISARMTIPLVNYMPENTTGPPGIVQGFEGAVVLSWGWDLTVHGQPRNHSHGCFHH